MYIGLLHKALDLAFKTQHYDTLLQIATDLDANSDPALIEKCSNYFMANEQFDKAVNLFAVGRKVGKIIICFLQSFKCAFFLSIKKR